MSSTDNDGSEDDDYDENESLGAEAVSIAEEGPADEEEANVQKKLFLFKSNSVQLSLKRVWEVLPQDDRGELSMDGYVEFNLRLQKCLTADFAIERAVDSAIGDWSEDVREGQEAMTESEFAMFLFELASLWCGTNISVRAYLLFLNATFLAITASRGSHTVGLRPLDDIERLPKSFFDMLAMHGWQTEPPRKQQPQQRQGGRYTSEAVDGIVAGEEATLTISQPHSDTHSPHLPVWQQPQQLPLSQHLDQQQQQYFGSWYDENLAPQSEQAALLQIQRQIFQMTHDFRAVLLFRQLDGRDLGESNILDVVKASANSLEKVAQADLTRPALADQPNPPTTKNSPRLELCPLPWCPPSFARVPGPAPRSTSSTAGAGTSSMALAIPSPRSQHRRRTHSTQHSLPPLALAVPKADPSAVRIPPEVVPVGRAFETRRASGRRRGLALIGKSVAEANQQIPEAAKRVYAAPIENVPVGEDAYDAVATPGSNFMPKEIATRRMSTMGSVRSARAGTPQESEVFYGAPSDAGDQQQLQYQASQVTSFLEAAQLSPPYKLPKNPPNLYMEQVAPLLKKKPSALVHAANKFQKDYQLVRPPFERIICQLPEDVQVEVAQGPDVGPFHNPNEPVWFEMNHRLQAILKRQGRRAERRKRRKARSKLATGRARGTSRHGGEAGGLRAHFDRAVAQPEQSASEPGQPACESLQKVHETYQMRRERWEVTRFEVRGLGGGFMDRSTIGQDPPQRPGGVVRPIYVPPPGSQMEYVR